MKTYKERRDLYEEMLEQRNTPHQGTGHSSAEMIFNRRMCGFLTGMRNSPKDTLEKEKHEVRRLSVKKACDYKFQKLSEIDVGQSVFFQRAEWQNVK